MSGDRRAPWWYSGDDDETVPVEPVSPDAAPESDATPDPDDSSSAMDWTALVAGAARMVDWATERVMVPHAEHTDPSLHPDCMVCRTVTLIGDPVGLMAGGSRPSADAEAGDDTEAAASGPVASSGPQPIRWIPIIEPGG